MKIVLIRHGDATDAEGRAIGHCDLPLSASGGADIVALARHWAGPPPAAIWCSDLARAADSAALFAAALGGPTPIRDPRLRELCFGQIDGLRWDDPQVAENPAARAWLDDWQQLAPPGGETLAAVHTRLRAFRAELPTRGTQLVFSHATPLRLWLLDALGWPSSRLFELAIPTASASGLRRCSAGFEVSFAGQRKPDFRTFLTDPSE